MTDGNDAAFTMHGTSTKQMGLTKREYFAAAALTGLCANAGGFGIDSDLATLRAVEMADELIRKL